MAPAAEDTDRLAPLRAREALLYEPGMMEAWSVLSVRTAASCGKEHWANVGYGKTVTGNW
jgi:hypothetical protein